MDFTNVIFERETAVVFRQPSLAQDVFSGQFSASVWAAAAALVVLMAAAVAMGSRLYTKCAGNDATVDKNEFGFLDSLEWVFCIVTQNGCSRQPQGAGNRALFLLVFVFGLLLFYSFAAKIVSALVSSQSIQSLQGLLDYGKIRWKEFNDIKPIKNSH